MASSKRPPVPCRKTRARPGTLARGQACKFNLQGRCARGSTCDFARTPEEMNALPDLHCTKLCGALSSTGRCGDTRCRFAHSRGELRMSSSASWDLGSESPCSASPTDTPAHQPKPCGPAAGANMQTTQYMVSHYRLSTFGSFNICDTQAHGFPILYASQGFVDLFGYTAAECVDLPCGSLVATPSILKHDPELLGLAGTLGMAPERIAGGLEILTQHARQELDYMMENIEQKVHVQVVNRRKSGDLFVCEVVMQAFVHPILGWKFCVGLQTDITADVSVRVLLDIALAGEYTTMHRAREESVSTWFASLDTRRNSTVNQYLALKASEVWLAFMDRMIGGGPPQAPTKATISDMLGAAGTKPPAAATSDSSARGEPSMSFWTRVRGP